MRSIAALLVLSLASMAEPITFNFEGSVTLASGIFSGEGRTVTGSYTLDTELADLYPQYGEEDYFVPWQPESNGVLSDSFALTVTVGGVTRTTADNSKPYQYPHHELQILASPEYQSLLFKAQPYAEDWGYIHLSDGFLSPADGIAVDPYPLPNAVPTTAPNVPLIDFATGVYVTYDHAGQTASGVEFEVTSITVANSVPEPKVAEQLVVLAWGESANVHYSTMYVKLESGGFITEYAADPDLKTPPATEILPRFIDDESAYKALFRDEVQQKFEDAGITNIRVVNIGDLEESDASRPATYVYFADGRSDGLLGAAYTGVDQFNRDPAGEAIVYLSLDLTEDVETTAHEIGHTFGLIHIRPDLDGDEAVIMDYRYEDPWNSRFYDESTKAWWQGQTLLEKLFTESHNPTYHLRRYVNGEAIEEIEDLSPGSYDKEIRTGWITTSLRIEGEDGVIYNVFVRVGGPDGDATETLLHFDEITLEDLAKHVFTHRRGSRFSVMGSSARGGNVFDVVMAFGQDATYSSMWLPLDEGSYKARLLKFEPGLGSYSTLADVVVTGEPIPEPCTLVLFGVAVCGYFLLCRRRNGTNVIASGSR